MTKDDIIRMAREAADGSETEDVFAIPFLERFANIVAASEKERLETAWRIRPRGKSTVALFLQAIRNEREACASECDEWIKNGSSLAEDIAVAIRARGNP